MFHASWHFGNDNDVGFWLLRNGTVIGNSQRTTENNVCFSVASMPTDYDDWKPQTISFNFLDIKTFASMLFSLRTLIKDF